VFPGQEAVKVGAMIVRKARAQIAFGAIAVVFTVVMVIMQVRNLQTEVELEEPEVAVAPVGPAPASDVRQEPPEKLPEPKPRPEPRPFVMKKVGGPDAIDGEYLVSFFDENDRRKFIDAVAKAGGKVLFLSEYGYVVKARLKDVGQFEAVLRAGPVPLDYSANYRVYYPERPVGGPPSPDKVYGVFGKNALMWLGLNADHSQWGAGAKVAVIDNGVTAGDVFKKNAVREIDLLEGRYVDGEAAGHGTAVASLIAGWHPEIMGVAPGAEIISVRVTGGDGMGDVLDVARGIMKALESGANVINLSLGTYGDSFVLRNAVQEAIKRGVAVVASVGNDGKNGTLFPAAYDGVVGVSAVDAMGQRLYFGNTGRAVDVCAPGYGVAAAWKGGLTDDFSGTSAAAPFVAGMIAALMGRGMTAEAASALVIGLADDSGIPGRDDEFGNGILDIRRIEERGEQGVRDAAVSGLVFRNGKSILVGVQNRGTEVLEGARLAIRSGERYINFDLGMTRPGETVSRQFDVQDTDFDAQGMLTVMAEIPEEGLRDKYPGNNRRRIVLVDPARAARR
jgi:hypothetical protein